MDQTLPDIIICLNELSTTCVYQAVVDYNCVGEIAILGYYDTDTILKAIERNVITATISIDTEQMGHFVWMRCRNITITVIRASILRQMLP